MAKTKALLVGVCIYFLPGCNKLPLVINDLAEMKKSLINGLNIDEDDITICGDKGIVRLNELIQALNESLKNVGEDDNYILYFSGHGAKDCLVLSDAYISLQQLIDIVSNFKVKSKLVILDSCYSGGFKVNNSSVFDVNTAVEKFVGSGYAVMASCGSEQVSGFDSNRKISLYTRFVCDALTCDSLIRKGKKSLEMINKMVQRFAELSNKSGLNQIQNPVFRSGIGGSVYFEVKEYYPYKIKHVY